MCTECCSEPGQRLRLGKVFRPLVHVAELGLRLGLALRCSEPKQPPRLCKVWWPAFAFVVHAAEYDLRLGVSLLCG